MTNLPSTPFARLHSRCRAVMAALIVVAAWAPSSEAAAPTGVPGSCQAVSAPQRATVVELYTSEGCDSCPPADRWLSTLKGRPDVLAAAFHVDYWDRLGWKDRFADPRHTARQAESQRHSGARFSYTPQVLVQGRDWKQWPSLPDSGRAVDHSAVVQIELERDGVAPGQSKIQSQVRVRVLPLAGAPATLALWWAVLEDGHVSAVKAGENAGAQLRHDHVVRAQGQRAPWRSADTSAWVVDAPAVGEGGRRSRLLVVVTDAASGASLQAVQLAC